MSGANRAIVAAFFLIAVGEAVLFWLIWEFGPKGNSVLRIDPLAAIVVITTVAVAIERVIEYIWSVHETFKGSFWPFTAISSHVDELTNDLDKASKQYIVQAS